MRIVCLSDTHLQHDFMVPDGDVLLHAGDATFTGTLPQVERFASWYVAFPHEYKLFVAGNHDWLFQHQPALARDVMQRHRIQYMEDSGLELGGLRFWGSPWQPEFGNWAFNLPRGSRELASKWDLIPDDTQVLVTHGPPAMILDQTAGFDGERPESVGCGSMRKRVDQLKRLKLHLFGHIHHSYGQATFMDEGQPVHFVNGSVCNERYNPTNAPIVVDL